MRYRCLAVPLLPVSGSSALGWPVVNDTIHDLYDLRQLCCRLKQPAFVSSACHDLHKANLVASNCRQTPDNLIIAIAIEFADSICESLKRYSHTMAIIGIISCKVTPCPTPQQIEQTTNVFKVNRIVWGEARGQQRQLEKGELIA